MSRENVEVVRRCLEASERFFTAYWADPRSLAAAVEADELWPEAAAVYAYFDPEVEWKLAFAGLTFRGRLEVARGWDEILDAVEDYRLTVREVTDLGGDQVLATLDRSLQGKQTEVEMSGPIFSLYTVRDELIVRLEQYTDRAEALEAVGLGE
jgi:ketosteroid isomerase-like protein